MSHFTEIKTRMTDREPLLRALRDLGYEPQEGPVEVRGYQGNRTTVDVKIATRSPGYDIGFRVKEGVYECVADWFGLPDIDRREFLNRLNQRYAYHAARIKLEEQGFALASEEVQEDGRIHLVLRRMREG